METLDATCLGKFSLILAWFFLVRGPGPVTFQKPDFFVIKAFFEY